MTDILQVMDLSANGPIKAGIRRERCNQLFNFFQAWKLLRLKAQLDGKPPPKFNPPKPAVVDGLRILRKVCSTTFATERYKESMRKCFISVGLAPDDQGAFKKYTNHRRGTLAITTADEKGYTCLGEVAAELEMVTRKGVDSDNEDGDDADESEDDEDEEEEEEDDDA